MNYLYDYPSFRFILKFKNFWKNVSWRQLVPNQNKFNLIIFVWDQVGEKDYYKKFLL